MLANLAGSGLVPADMPGGVTPLPNVEGIERFTIHYPGSEYFRTRWNRADDKYMSPRGVSTELYRATPEDEFNKAHVNAAIEGEKSSQCFALTTGIPTVGLPGCWGFAEPQEEGSESRALRLELLNGLTPGRTHIVGLDGDWATNTRVATALATYVLELVALGVVPFVPDFGFDTAGNRLGYDDWFISRWGIERENWPSQEEARRNLFSLPVVPWAELEEARSWSLSSSDRFNQGHVDKSDRGNSTLWLNMLGRSNIRFIDAHSNSTWMHWQKDRWVDIGRTPVELTNLVSRRYYLRSARLYAIARQMSEATEDEKNAKKRQEQEAKACAVWAEGRCSSFDGRKALLADAGSRKGIRCTLADFDVDPNILAVQNGVVDLKTGALRPETREDMISRRCSVPYPDVEPTGIWALRASQFVREITGEAHGKPCVERERWLCRRIGAALHGSPSLQSLDIWNGKGANGKTVLAKLLQATLGGYAVTVPAGVLLTSKGQRDAESSSPFLYSCVNRRIVFVAETKDTAYLDEAKVKGLTGDDKLPVRRNYGDAEGFTVTFTIILLTNHLPNVAQGDEAIWDRLSPFEFRCRWLREGKLTVSEGDEDLPKADKALLEVMPTDIEARQWILWWAVQGGVEWRCEGLGTAPTDVQESAHEYRDDQDMLKSWLDDGDYRLGSELLAPSGEIYSSYKNWCEAQKLIPVSNKLLLKRLKARFPNAKLEAKESNGRRFTKGIGLKIGGRY